MAQILLFLIELLIGVLDITYSQPQIDYGRSQKNRQIFGCELREELWNDSGLAHNRLVAGPNPAGPT